ncbi:hypothetical protein GCM10027167_72010 [Nocardia heshunensis]
MLAVTAITLTAPAGEAAPPTDDGNAVSYAVTRQSDAALLRVTGGGLEIIGDQLVLTDPSDLPVAAVPLSYRVDDTAYPIEARIDGDTATLTPDTADGQPVPSAQSVNEGETISVDQAASQVAESFSPRDNQALGVFAQREAIAAAVSAVVGAVVGAGVGCLVGAAVGGTVTSPAMALLLPFVGGIVAGCVVGAATLGAAGSTLGLVGLGGPITLFAAIQYFSTILAPCPPDTTYCQAPTEAPAAAH